MTFIPFRNPEWSNMAGRSMPPTVVFIAIAVPFGPIMRRLTSIGNGECVGVRRAIISAIDRSYLEKIEWAPIWRTSANAVKLRNLRRRMRLLVLLRQLPPVVLRPQAQRVVLNLHRQQTPMLT